MKLWLLRPIGRPNGSDADDIGPMPAPDHWEPWYDKAFGFVVRAETEAEARSLASERSGDEARSSRRGTGSNPWMDARLSVCVELPADGKPGVIIRDFASA